MKDIQNNTQFRNLCFPYIVSATTLLVIAFSSIRVFWHFIQEAFLTMKATLLLCGIMNTCVLYRSFVPPVRDEESETQRKAHAKRVRETRRSTQGVTLDEIKSAEKLVQKKQQQNSDTPTTQVKPYCPWDNILRLAIETLINRVFMQHRRYSISLLRCFETL